MADNGELRQATNPELVGRKMDALARISPKEIECVFGIMKKKFAILAHPMTRHYEGDCESVVKVCACLYNMTRPDPTRRAPERNGGTAC